MADRSSSGPAGAGPRRVLVVDDNFETLQLVRLVLERSGYEVWLAESGPQALTLLERRGLPHLALLDVNMPGMNGLEFWTRARAYGDFPAIMLTAVNSENEVVKALEPYAEDYITKPFRPANLIARIEAVLRRIDDYNYALKRPTAIDEHLVIDLAGRQVVVDGAPVPLTSIETKLLSLLVQNLGHFLSAEALMAHLWPAEAADRSRLYVHIFRLRRKLRVDADQHDYIISRSGAGYCLGTVSEQVSSGPSPA